jgi:hypothetical protein
MRAEIETSLSMDPTLGGLVQHVEWAGTETELTGSMERPAGFFRMSWNLVWAAVFGDPTTVLPM